MKLGTRLTLYLSLIIIGVLSGYAYLHLDARREVLVRLMKIEVRSISETLRVSQQKISLPREMLHVQELLDAISEPERTLGVIFYHRERDIVFRSHSLQGETGHFLEGVKEAVRENRPREEFAHEAQQKIISEAESRLELEENPQAVGETGGHRPIGL